MAANIVNMAAHRPENNTANLRTSQQEAAEKLNVSERSVNTTRIAEFPGSRQMADSGIFGNFEDSDSGTDVGLAR